MNGITPIASKFHGLCETPMHAIQTSIIVLYYDFETFLLTDTQFRELVYGPRTVMGSEVNNLVRHGSAGLFTSTTGKVGNAVTSTGFGPTDFLQREFPPRLVSDVFTLRVWINVQANYFTLPGANGKVLNIFGSSAQYDLVVGIDGLPIWAYGTTSPTAYAAAVGDVSVLDGAWHRLIVYVDAKNDKLGIQMDNEPAPVEVAMTSPMRMGSLQVRRGGMVVDELGMWEGLWSDSQKDYDWDGGTGKTYPDVPL